MAMFPSRFCRALLGACLWGAGCVGDIGAQAAGGDPPEPGSTSGRGATGGGVAAAGGAGGAGSIGDKPVACEGTEAGPAPVRRLTQREYDNVVRELFGVTTGVGYTLQGDGEIAGFRSNAENPVTANLARDYQETAEALGRAAM